MASAPSESVVKVTMKIGDHPSEFKKAMLELKQGMKIRMRGQIGQMHIIDDSPSLFIAGGIGITPFRAMLNDLVNSRSESTKQLHLLYMNREGIFVYQAELDEISKITGIKINYLHSREDLLQEIGSFTKKYKNTGKYYLAGSRSMVDGAVVHLRKNIKKDTFIGYKG